MTTESSNKKILVTSALPYANGPLHIGHLSGAYLSADIFVRYLRLIGKDVAFVCGSDEHGAAVTIRAKKEGISPKDIVDKYHNLIKETFDRIGLSFDIYHRTTEPIHHETAQDFFLTLEEKGDEFLKETSEQYYDEEYDQFLADRYIQGTCPNCGYEDAYGDQCENCGTALSPLELKSPRSTLSGKAPVLKETTHWYIRLDKHTEWLGDWIRNGTLRGEQHHKAKEWKKHVVGQCLSWIDGELVPRSITRDLDWGIPVPLPEGKGKVLYVWFDAPIGYISATREWAKNNGKNWEDYWKGEHTELYHFIGKDNIVFHCIIFPSMLKAHGDASDLKFALPTNVPANQFVNLEGEKMSTSRNWAVWVHEYLDEFDGLPNKEDALRYALIRNMPELKDSDFTW
ncbi:MAG: methionine--tRNA ligase, partial [Bacteroidota bacterium]